MSVLYVRDDGSSNPFPTGIRSDDWIAYHGTSAAYADKIEAEGLGHGGIPDWFDDAYRLFELCKETYYFGSSPGGVTTLPFVLSNAEVSSRLKLVYLAENFERACVFASAPGGESINAIGVALDDWRRLATSRELQQEHHEELVRRAAVVGGDSTVMRDPARREAAAMSWHPDSEVRKVARALSLLESPENLRQRVARFQRLGDLVDEIRSRHAPLVYAVRLSLDELVGGDYSPSAGIALLAVPPEHIVAKCRLESERDTNQSSDDGDLGTMARWLARFESNSDVRFRGHI